MKSPNYVAVLAILNAMLSRVSASLAQIEQATRGLSGDEIPADAGVGINGSGKAHV